VEANNNQDNLFELLIDHQANGYLEETAKWTRFLSILGFIFCGLIVIVAIFFGSILSSVFLGRGEAGSIGTGAGIAVAVIYVMVALLYFFPCFYLFNFSGKIQAALRGNDQTQLNLAFKNLKSCFKFWGIFTIVLHLYTGIHHLRICPDIISAALYRSKELQNFQAC
jgi:hypothetical protein